MECFFLVDYFWRKKKWEKFRARESNQNKSHNTTSLLLEDTKIPSQNVNQNSLKDTPILIKRSYADVLVNRNELVNEGANEFKSVEETKIDNRAMWNKNKVKREERDGSLEKIDLKKIYSQLLEEEQSRSGDRNKSTPPNISTNSSQLKNDSGFSPIEENIFSTQDKEFLSVLEELQNGNVSNNIDSTTRHLTACTPAKNTVSFESAQNINTSFAYPDMV